MSKFPNMPSFVKVQGLVVDFDMSTLLHRISTGLTSLNQNPIGAPSNTHAAHRLSNPVPWLELR